jgi:hypothetical protein
MDAIIEEVPRELHVATGSEEGEDAEEAEAEAEVVEVVVEEEDVVVVVEEEGLPPRVRLGDPDARALADVPLASGRKRSYHDGEEADDGGGEIRSSTSKRVKSNDGGRISTSAPSGASTSAGRHTLRSTKVRLARTTSRRK